MNYYLIEQSGRRWITTDHEQFGGDTGAKLIQSSSSIEILSETAMSALNEQIEHLEKYHGEYVDLERRFFDYVEQNKQLSEQLQQKNFSS